MRPIVVLPVAYQSPSYFSTLPHKGGDIQKNVLEHEMCALIFYTNFV
jgi:hypothetical protein